jgi:hypothetical protein
MLVNVNPSVEVKSGFETVKPGTYRMRIKSVEDRNPEKNDLKVTLEFTDPSTLLGLDGQALKGQAGSLFDYVMLDNDKQWKLRMITEAAGLPWANYDPVVELPGRELDVAVKTEAYEGEQRNKVGRYVVPK